MNKLQKTVITLTAIGVAVKEIKKRKILIKGKNSKLYSNGTYKFSHYKKAYHLH